LEGIGAKKGLPSFNSALPTGGETTLNKNNWTKLNHLIYLRFTTDFKTEVTKGFGRVK